MGINTNRIQVSEDVLLPGDSSVKEHVDNTIIHLSTDDREQLSKVIGGVYPLFPNRQFGEGYPTTSITAIRIANPSEHLPSLFKEIIFKDVQNSRTATDSQVLVVQFEIGGHVVTEDIVVSNKVTASWAKGDNIHYAFEKAIEVKPEYDNVIIYVQWSNVAEVNPETATSTIMEANVPHLYYDNSSISVPWFSTRTSTSTPWTGAWTNKARPIEFVAASKFDLLQEKIDEVQQGGGDNGSTEIDREELKEIIAEVLGTTTISLGEDPDSNVNCQSIELTEVHIPTDFEVSSIMIHSRTVNNPPTTDPLYLSVWEQVGTSTDYELLAVSRNTQVQVVNTWSEWMFEGLKLNGKKIRIACLTSPDLPFAQNSMFGICCQTREEDDSCVIHTKTTPINYHPTMRIKGAGSLPYAPITHVGDPTHITPEERAKWDGYQTTLSNKVNSTTFSSHKNDTTMHLTEDEHSKLTQLLENGGTNSGGDGETTIDPNEIITVKGIKVTGGDSSDAGITWSENFHGNLDLGYYSTISEGRQWGNINLGHASTISGGSQYGTVNLGYSSTISGGSQLGNVILGYYSTISGGSQCSNVILGYQAKISGNLHTTSNTWIIGSLSTNNFESQVTTRYGLTLIGTGTVLPESSNSVRYQVYWPNSPNYPAQIHGWQEWRPDYNVKDANGNMVVQDGILISPDAAITPDDTLTIKCIKVTGGDSRATGINWSYDFYGNLDLGQYATISYGALMSNVNIGSYSTISNGFQWGNVTLGYNSTISDGTQWSNVVSGYGATISGGTQHSNVYLGATSTLSGGTQNSNVILGYGATISGNANTAKNTWIIAGLQTSVDFAAQVPTRYGLTLIGTGTEIPEVGNTLRYQVYWPDSRDYPAQIHGWQEWNSDYNVKDADGNIVVQAGKLIAAGSNNEGTGSGKLTKLFPTINFNSVYTTDSLTGIRIDNPYLHVPEYIDEIVFRNVQNEKTGDHTQQVLIIHFSVQGQDIVEEATVVSHHTTGLWNVGDDIHFQFDETVHVKPEYTRMMIYLTWKTNADANPNRVPDTIIAQNCPSVKYDTSSANLSWFDTRTSTAAPWTGAWKSKPRDIAFITNNVVSGDVSLDPESIITVKGVKVTGSDATETGIDWSDEFFGNIDLGQYAKISGGGQHGNVNLGSNATIAVSTQYGNIISGKQTTISGGSQYGNVLTGSGAKITGGSQWGNVTLGQSSTISNGTQSSNTNLGQQSTISGGIQNGVVTVGAGSTISNGTQQGTVLTGMNITLSGSLHTLKNTWILGGISGSTNFGNQITVRYGLTLIGTGNSTPSASNTVRYQVYWPSSEDYPAQIHGWQEWNSDYNVKDADGRIVIQDGKSTAPQIVLCNSEDELPAPEEQLPGVLYCIPETES